MRTTNSVILYLTFLFSCITQALGQTGNSKYIELIPKVNEIIQKTNVTAVSIAIIENYKVVWARGFGVKEKETKDSVNTETLFQAASISKPVLALAALKMVQENTLNLDADVNSKLISWKVPPNEFTNTEKVTLRRLLSHTAGTTVPGFLGYSKKTPLPNTLQVLQGVPPANNPPVQVYVKPGTMYSYSGGGYYIIEQLVTDVENKPIEKIIMEKVFNPLAFQRSTYTQEAEQLQNFAVGHVKGKVIEDKFHKKNGYAGLWSTPQELAQLLCEIQLSLKGESNKILNQDYTALMLKPVKQKYGLGFMEENRGYRLFFGHGGHNIGYVCHMTASFENGDGMVIMTNTNEGWKAINRIFTFVGKRYWGF